MFRSKLIHLCMSLVMALALSIPGTNTVLAAPPANDNFADAKLITTLPFSTTVDISEATTEPDELQYCEYLPWTVWYSFTPSTEVVLRADMAGTQIYANLNVYRADGPGWSNLETLGCTVYDGPIIFTAQAGKTYYFQAGGISETGNVQVNLVQIPPPENDDFDNAMEISLGDSHDADNTGAGMEFGEPIPTCAPWADKTVWFWYTPTSSGSVAADPSEWWNFVAAYTGSDLGSLDEVGCRNSGDPLPLHVEAGTTYYFQVGTRYKFYFGWFTFQLYETPPPTADFWWRPGDPNIFDQVEFYDSSYDPVEAWFSDYWWDFGDGTSTTGDGVLHQFAADGDYSVWHKVQTSDGRTAEVTKTVAVRTHDVAITSVTAPKAASGGQTRQISVNIRNHRYPETVVVELYKSTPGGFEHIGTLRQFVPVRQGNRTTRFDFSYTFTSDDARIGKVTFKAIASIENARDALPADNEAISSPPTKVQ